MAKILLDCQELWLNNDLGDFENMPRNRLKHIISEFQGITLGEMDEVKLMNRVDTKFAFNFSQLVQILESLKMDYKILEIEGTRIPFYESLYFDEKNFKFYNDHYLGKENRFKVRFRKYVESNLSFLEIKHKIKGRTRKSRINAEEIAQSLNSDQQHFLEKVLNSEIELVPKLWNSFHRMTLVNNTIKERLTLDFQLKFKWDHHEVILDNLVIAELKQEQVNRNSPFFSIMKSMVIRPYRLSKYCMGALEIYGSANLKYNRFKEKLRHLKKINDLN